MPTVKRGKASASSIVLVPYDINIRFDVGVGESLSVKKETGIPWKRALTPKTVVSGGLLVGVRPFIFSSITGHGVHSKSATPM